MQNTVRIIEQKYRKNHVYVKYENINVTSVN